MKIEDAINTLDPQTLNHQWVIEAVEALKAENKAQAAEIERLEFENQGYESRERSYCAQIEGHDAEIESLKQLLGSSLCHSHGENIVSGCEWCDAVGVALKGDTE
jgi:hypothetical protein